MQILIKRYFNRMVHCFVKFPNYFFGIAVALVVITVFKGVKQLCIVVNNVFYIFAGQKLGQQQKN